MSQGKQIFAFCHKLLKQDVEYFNITVPQENVNFAQFVPALDFGMILQKNVLWMQNVESCRIM